LLTLQFNPRSQISDADLASIHETVGVAPVFPADPGAQQWVTDLARARNILADAYAFDSALVGDEVGENGW